MNNREKINSFKIKLIKKEVDPIILKCYSPFIQNQYDGFGKEFLRFFQAFGGELNLNSYLIAAAIELFIEFGYITDDIADEDVVRGKGPAKCRADQAV